MFSGRAGKSGVKMISISTGQNWDGLRAAREDATDRDRVPCSSRTPDSTRGSLGSPREELGSSPRPRLSVRAREGKWLEEEKTREVEGSARKLVKHSRRLKPELHVSECQT